MPMQLFKKEVKGFTLSTKQDVAWAEACDVKCTLETCRFEKPIRTWTEVLKCAHRQCARRSVKAATTCHK